MGRVFKALSRAESERGSTSFAAAAATVEEPEPSLNQEEQPPAELFDFAHYSLNAPAAGAVDPLVEGNGGGAEHGVAPARQATLNASRIDPHLVAFYDFDPTAAREYHKTANTLISAAARGLHRRILITSARHGDGRTCVTLNLAGALAQAKKRVLVVDTDMQRPSSLRLLGIEAETGIAEAVSGNSGAESAAIRIMPYGFDLLPMRHRVDNSAEILASPSFRRMLDDCDRQYDFMLFDSSPLLDSKDISLLIGLTHANVMVVRPGSTNGVELGRAIQPLEQEAVIGVILNRSI